MRSILLIGVNSKYTHSNLAIRYMRSYADLPIFECSINDDLFSVYQKLLQRNEEYFCFSTYIWNVEFIIKLCKMLSSVRTDLKIILGGPEAAYNKERLFKEHSWLFGCCAGEGEEFALKLKTSEHLTEIPNFSFRENDKIIENKFEKTDLSKLKFPYTKQDLECELKNKIIYFETSRGCLFNCAYCLSSVEGNTRYFPMDYVKKGLDFFMENEVPLVKFVDRSFNENNTRAVEIVSHILEYNKVTKFHFEIVPQLISDEFISLCAKKPDFFQFEMGIQTTNKDTMKEIHRIFDIEQTAKKIKTIPKSIHQHLDLIAGLPNETITTFKEGFNYVYRLNPDMLQVGFLKLLEHTDMKNRASDFNIITTEFPPYEVLSTSTMSANDIIKIKRLENAVDRIYNSGAFKQSLSALNLQNPFDFYLNLGKALYKEEYEAPLSRQGLYEFIFKRFPEIKKSLVVDFLNNNHKAKLPECFQDENVNVKEILKAVKKLPEFNSCKLKLVFAADSVFAVSDNSVKEITEFVKKLS